uniref:Integrase_H2C2 domain-containing protein n=1 Tax=Mesocestoides corti TaxID=53468 RepID=A0A5K3F6R3_MESCO
MELNCPTMLLIPSSSLHTRDGKSCFLSANGKQRGLVPRLHSRSSGPRHLLTPTSLNTTIFCTLVCRLSRFHPYSRHRSNLRLIKALKTHEQDIFKWPVSNRCIDCSLHTKQPTPTSMYMYQRPQYANPTPVLHRSIRH